jgi:hypothetical protein
VETGVVVTASLAIAVEAFEAERVDGITARASLDDVPIVAAGLDERCATVNDCGLEA